MSKRNMPSTVRLTDREQELLRKKSIEINKALINNDMKPYQESELVHLILQNGLDAIRVNSKGDIYFEETT